MEPMTACILPTDLSTKSTSMRARSMYPPPESIVPWSSEKRPLVPILEHPPSSSPLPRLPPKRANGSLLDEWYTLSTHVVPAAFPRTTPDIELPAGSHFVLSPGTTREEKQKQIKKLRDAYFDPKVRHWDGRLGGQSEKRLWSCVDRFVRKGSESGSGSDEPRLGTTRKKLTLFLAHANGFTKEIWEPVLRYLCLDAKRNDVVFDEIWSFEAVNHGDSAIINGDNLCALYDWSDHTRDMLNFMINYMPDSLEESSGHLTRVPTHVSEYRKQFGFHGRDIVAVGHSFGGNTLSRAAIEYPALFSTLVSIDPILYRPPLDTPWIEGRGGDVELSVTVLVEAALQRREKWSSKEQALQLFRKNPFFACWNPASLDIFIECAICNDEDGGVRLKMSKFLETAVFTERRASFEVWDLLPELDERVELRYVMPGNLNYASMYRERQELMYLRPQNVSNVIIAGTDHMIPQQAPEDLAYDIHQLIQRKYGAVKAKL